MQLGLTGFKVPSMSNAMALTSQSIISNLGGVVSQTTKLTHLDWKPRRENLALICSSVLIAKINIR